MNALDLTDSESRRIKRVLQKRENTDNPFHPYFITGNPNKNLVEIQKQ